MRIARQAPPVAVLQDESVLQNHDLVHALDGSQAVGNDDHCPVRCQLVERPFDQPLGAPIEARGGFIENHQARRSEEDAGKGEQLRFPRGETPVVREHSVQPLGQRRIPRRHTKFGNDLPQALVRNLRDRKGSELSRTVPWNSCTFCVTIPMRSRRSGRVLCRTSCPPSRIVPLCGS